MPENWKATFTHEGVTIGVDPEGEFRYNIGDDDDPRWDRFPTLQAAKDATYRERPEWISPHQRGLANDLYIPATRKYEGGKVASERMLEYLGEPLVDKSTRQ